MQIDSTGLDIIAIGDDGRPVQVELTAAIDVVSRTIIGAMIVPKVRGRGPRGRRLGGRATRSFDAVLMLAQALAPMPARPGWSPQALAEQSEMPYADLVACDPRMAGAAARPVIRPRMVVVDHGKIFNSEHFDDVCRMLDIKVRPARERTATDKAVIESTFNAIKRRFSQYVAGYTGSDLRRRGKHVNDGPLWSLNELQDLLNEWIALDWQQKPHDGLRSPFLPGLTISPNHMYATLVAVEGHVPLVLHAPRSAPPPVPDDPDMDTERDFEPTDADPPADTGGSRVQEPARAYRTGVLSLRGGAAEVFGITQPPVPRAAPSSGAGESGDEEDDGGES
ncbi:hypothetical protein [Streptomyces fungicidicus]|uniref:hypothetical protein n=1 Tax=Streptomyces fungicidicus TaxID=68203 RepID=UPI00381E12F5